MLSLETLNMLIQKNVVLDSIVGLGIQIAVEKAVNTIKEKKKETLEEQLYICIDNALQLLCKKYTVEYDLNVEEKFLEQILRNKDLLSEKVWKEVLTEILYININCQILQDWLVAIDRTIAEEKLEKLRDYIFLQNIHKESARKVYPRILTKKPAMPPEEYVDREEFQEILAMLRLSKKLVLVNGIGGIGKSTVCRKIFHELEKGKDRTLAWVIYHDKNLIEDLSQQLFYPRNGKEWEERFIQFLQQDIEEDAIIFIDNLNRTEEEEPFLEALANANCNVICTSRIEKFQNYEVVPIGFMDEKNCVELFYNYYKREFNYEKIRHIVSRAGFHTLVIEILGKIGNAESYSLDELEEELEKKGFNLEGVASVEKKEDTLIGHLSRTFDTSRLNECQKNILYCLSILPVQWIPLRLREWLGLNNSYNINYLVKYAWFVKNDDGLYMHPVVKEVVKRIVTTSEKILYQLLSGIGKELKYQENPKIEESMLLCSFAEAVLKNISEKNYLEVAEVIYSISMLYGQFGDYKRAKEYVEESISILEGMEGQEELVASAYNHKGYICYYLYQDEEAEKSYKVAYAIRKNLKNKRMYAQTASNLSLLYQGIWASKEEKESNEARKILDMSEQYQREAVKIFENIFKGEIHSNLASAYNNMAVLKNSQKKYEQAVFYYKKAEKIRLALHNVSLNDLSVTYLGLCNSYMDRAGVVSGDIYKLHNYKMALFYLRKGKEIRVKEIREGNQKLSVEEMEEKEIMLNEYIEQIKKDSLRG